MPARLFRVEPPRGYTVPTSHWILVARASAAIETHPTDLLRIPVEEQAELFALPTNEGVSPEARLEQARRVLDWWPTALLLEAARLEVPWHLLYEPTRWADVEHQEVWKYIDAYRQTRGRWPNIGPLRERFGRRHNHPVRLPKGQGELELER